MNELEVVSTKEILGRSFTVYGTVEEPLFLDKDVAEMIDYAYKDSRKKSRDVSKMIQCVDDDEKVKQWGIIYDEKGGKNLPTGAMWFLTENGLYEVLFQSTKPIAKEFKGKVKELLHDLRLNRAKVEYISKKSKEEIDLERAKFIYEVGQESPIETYKEICSAISVNMVAGQNFLPMPKLKAQIFTASQIAEELHISKRCVGEIANKNNLKTEENGEWIWDRAANGKQVKNFVYNSTGFEKIKEFANA